MKYIKPKIAFVLLLCLPSIALSQYKLTMEFKSMTPHVGQKLEIRVTDKESGINAGHVTVPSIPSADFDVNLHVLVKDHSYWVDFYADHNGNGVYDAPPTDHTWRLELNNAQGNSNLVFTHHATFIDVQIPPKPAIEQFSGIWVGFWENLTYSTTDTMIAFVAIDADSQKIMGSATTKGAFGNPDPVTFIFEGYYEADEESIKVSMPAPWIGEILFTGGQISGSVTDPTFIGFGLTLAIAGTFWEDQLILTYEMSGAFSANGVVLINKVFSSAVEPADNDVIPIDFTLQQNFPNPFNPTTQIQYNLPISSNVRITIYNLQGQVIRTLVDTQKPAGYFTEIWDSRIENGTRASSGIYLYRIEAHGVNGRFFIQEKKMMLVK